MKIKDIFESIYKEVKLDEVIKSASKEEYVDDFIKSDAPQFKGKSKKKRTEMATAAYYSDKK